MKIQHRSFELTLLSLWLVLAACGGNSFKKGQELMRKGDYNSAILQLRVAEGKHPYDWKIKRALGVAYYKNQQLNFAITKLYQARQLKLDDLPTLLYLGLSYEAAGKLEDANTTFRTLLSLNIESALRKELLARMRDNQIKLLTQEIKQNIADWRAGKESPITPNSVAVLYFRNVSEWREMDPILKGLAELITLDLLKVKNLRLSDRIKVQLLLEELQFSPADFFDQIRAADAGRLLGVQHLISGGVERIDDTKIRLSGGVVETATGQLRGSGSEASGSFSDILKLEKQLVMDLIQDLGIRLAPSEASAIQTLPTFNSLAFIAFCKGLDSEDRQLFSEAQSYYQSALNSDPNFTLAKERLSQLPGERLSISELEKLAS